MTTTMFARQLVDVINTHYEKETLYLCKKDFGKCYTKEDKQEVSNWGLKEWAARILREEEIGDISEFYRADIYWAENTALQPHFKEAEKAGKQNPLSDIHAEIKALGLDGNVFGQSLMDISKEDK